MSQPQQSTLLVTGASGQLGRRVIELLLENGVSSIIAATRTPEKLADFAARGVDVRRADFDDPDSLAAAFAGADRLLLISTEIFGEQRQRQHLNAVRAADAAGVKHILYTSLINPVGSPVTLAPDHAKTEQAIADSRMGYTVLRNNIYMDELPTTLERAIGSGVLSNAVGDGRIAYVTREDCAQAAAGALLAAFDGRRILDVTGPEGVSPADLVRLAAELSGKPVQYVPLSAEAYTEVLVGAGLPGFVADLIVSFDVAAAQGLLDVVTDNVAILSGKRPTSAREFISARLQQTVR
jgi:NAD(P)H dehydrogenase (quinone)